MQKIKFFHCRIRAYLYPVALAVVGAVLMAITYIGFFLLEESIKDQAAAVRFSYSFVGCLKLVATTIKLHAEKAKACPSKPAAVPAAMLSHSAVGY